MCECTIDMAEAIEENFTDIEIYKIQYICDKCGLICETVKNTKKGTGFIKWAKDKFNGIKPTTKEKE